MTTKTFIVGDDEMKFRQITREGDINKYLQYLHNYKVSNYKSIYDCYSHPTPAKRAAERYCKELCDKLNGYGFKITNYSRNIFTAAFKFKYNDEEYLAFITRDYYNIIAECIAI